MSENDQLYFSNLSPNHNSLNSIRKLLVIQLIYIYIFDVI